MELPEINVTTVFFTGQECAICERPCLHEIADSGVPFPGAFDKATIDDTTKAPTPVCDPCVERHYPDRIAEVEAARLHYWSH